MSFLEFENLDIFTKGEFSVVASVDSATFPHPTLRGIFDEGYGDMFDSIDAQTAENKNFCFRVQTTETDLLRHNDFLTFQNETYRITSIQPQQDGKLTKIILKQEF